MVAFGKLPGTRRPVCSWRRPPYPNPYPALRVWPAAPPPGESSSQVQQWAAVAMASHRVALDSEAYAALKSLKARDESFSDVVKRLARPRRSILDLAGAWRDLPASDRRALNRYYRALKATDKIRPR